MEGELPLTAVECATATRIMTAVRYVRQRTCVKPRLVAPDEQRCGQDCAGRWGGGAVRDRCGICGGDGGSCQATLPPASTPSGGVACTPVLNQHPTAAGLTCTDATNSQIRNCKNSYTLCESGQGVALCSDGSRPHPTADRCTRTPVVQTHFASAQVDRLAASVDAKHETYRLRAVLGTGVTSVYSVFGSRGNHMVLPPAYQASGSRNAHVGGVDPLYFQGSDGTSARYDSWLTVGLTAGDPGRKLSTIGQDWGQWLMTRGVSCSNCAVFWMDPTRTTATRDAGPVVLGQVTLPSGTSTSVELGLSGKLKDGSSWRQNKLVFAITSNSTRPNATAATVIRDCNGVINGPAVKDRCETCDANKVNDCKQDCAGIWGGTASCQPAPVSVPGLAPR
eukprot:COSAG01_NODE_4295_length_5165_cov_49.577971_5_plen_393_part_00